LSLNIFYRDEKYCIKKNYKINHSPKYYIDAVQNFTYSPDIYELAYYLVERSNAKFLIDIGSGNGEKLKKFKDLCKVIIFDYKENIQTIKSNFPWIIANECDLENGLTIDNDILSNSVVICAEVVEHIVHPKNLIKNLSYISKTAQFLLLSTPDRVRARGINDYGPPGNQCHVREWSLEEFNKLLIEYDFAYFFIGYTVNTDFHLWKNNILCISGKQVNIITDIPQKKILAIMHVYNEIDFIQESIEHLLNQNIDIIVLDNWSNDGTYEKILELKKKYSQALYIERFPNESTFYYEWENQLKKTEEISRTYDYDWFIHYDSDEIRLSPWQDITLRQAISFIDYLGYNTIDFTVLDFRPTETASYFKEMKVIEKNSL